MYNTETTAGHKETFTLIQPYYVIDNSMDIVPPKIVSLINGVSDRYGFAEITDENGATAGQLDYYLPVLVKDANYGDSITAHIEADDFYIYNKEYKIFVELNRANYFNMNVEYDSVQIKDMPHSTTGINYYPMTITITINGDEPIIREVPAYFRYLVVNSIDDVSGTDFITPFK